MSVACSRFHFKDTLINCQQSHIESATTQVKHQHRVFRIRCSLAILLLIEPIGNSSSSGFIQDSLNRQTSDSTGVLGGLSLSIVEISRNSDNSVANLLP
mmetsp:Transcript_27687/g.46806  ORF Transcript_27687/g.46806 Transcript_27687/m.46806 type:complete len:99 (-) Transcript_27687:733-1029(-)